MSARSTNTRLLAPSRARHRAPPILRQLRKNDRRFAGEQRDNESAYTYLRARKRTEYRVLGIASFGHLEVAAGDVPFAT